MERCRKLLDRWIFSFFSAESFISGRTFLPKSFPPPLHPRFGFDWLSHRARHSVGGYAVSQAQVGAVIMAENFWDLLGGAGTYTALIGVFENVGRVYREKIRKEYLGL